jgi:hypothetical protein
MLLFGRKNLFPVSFTKVSLLLIELVYYTNIYSHKTYYYALELVVLESFLWD